MRLFSILSFGLLAGRVHTNPVSTETTLFVRDAEYDEYKALYDKAEEFYPGIFWISAMETCTLDQFNDLYLAVAGVVGLIRDMNSGVLFDGELGDSAAWNKFFMPGKDWKEQYPDEFDSMIDIYNQTASFIQEGRRGEKNRHKRRWRAAFVCGDEQSYSRCRRQSNTVAYVPDVPGRIENCPKCYTVAFCDPFFKLPKIVSVVQDNHFTEENMNDPKLHSKEHAVFHEFMHVDLVGQPWHIMDLLDEKFTSDGLSHPVYGAKYCNEYAWSRSSENKVNEKVRLSADNYAWVMSYAYYALAFGWGVK